MNKRNVKQLFLISAIFLIILSACTGETPSVELTITFDSNGGTIVESISYANDKLITIPDNPSKEGYIFDGWYWDNETFERLFTIDSLLNEHPQFDFTVYAKWSSVMYNITYVLNGGVNHDDNPKAFSIGTTIEIFEPTKEGYTFNGWYSDAEFLNISSFLSMPGEDVTLYAKWIINSYTLEFLDDNNNLLQTAVYQYGADLSGVTPPEVNKIGYSFDGWNIELPLVMPSTNLTLLATYHINKYTITFETSDGTHIGEITQDYNTIVIAPEDPEKIGYTFGGWYRDEDLTEVYVFTRMQAEDIMVYPKWNINQYSIRYNTLTDDNDSLNYIALNPGETIVQVCLGDYSSSALSSLGRLFTWGRNIEGQLGDNSSINKHTPTEITHLFNLIDDISENDVSLITDLLRIKTFKKGDLIVVPGQIQKELY